MNKKSFLEPVVSFKPLKRPKKKGFYHLDGVFDFSLSSFEGSETVYVRCCVCGELFCGSGRIWIFFPWDSRYLLESLSGHVDSFEFVKGDYLVFDSCYDYFYCSEDCRVLKEVME